MEEIKWHWYEFDEMSPSTLYEYLRLRQQIFIIEQHCIYADLDDHDQLGQHLIGFTPDGHMAACLRLLPPGSKYPEPSLGRIAVTPKERNQKLGHLLVDSGIAQARALYPGLAIRIQAQAHLQAFYQQHGFDPVGEPYDEDGIAHIEMFITP